MMKIGGLSQSFLVDLFNCHKKYWKYLQSHDDQEIITNLQQKKYTKNRFSL